MHQHLRTLLPHDVTLADLVAGRQVLAQTCNDTNSEVLHRRKTCAELAGIAAQLISAPGHLSGGESVASVAGCFPEKRRSPRLASMAKTFARELVELQSASERAGALSDVCYQP
jgi:hypothetical protein